VSLAIVGVAGADTTLGTPLPPVAKRPKSVDSLQRSLDRLNELDDAAPNFVAHVEAVIRDEPANVQARCQLIDRLFGVTDRSPAQEAYARAAAEQLSAAACPECLACLRDGLLTCDKHWPIPGIFDGADSPTRQAAVRFLAALDDRAGGITSYLRKEKIRWLAVDEGGEGGGDRPAPYRSRKLVGVERISAYLEEQGGGFRVGRCTGRCCRFDVPDCGPHEVLLEKVCFGSDLRLNSVTYRNTGM
jgi:hypothetical protein